MSGFYTNRGKQRLNQWTWNNTTKPTNFYAALLTNDIVPDNTVNLMSDVDEITAGDGYTSGGLILTPNTTDFPNATEDDASESASIDVKTLSWLVTGTRIPAVGTEDVYWVAITDDNGTVANREVIVLFDLGWPRSSTTTLSIPDLVMRVLEPA